MGIDISDFSEKLALVRCMANGAWAADLTPVDRQAIQGVLEDRDRLFNALAFAESVIKCGEPWSARCDEVISTALNYTLNYK